jgi:hypothetical protein
MTYTYIPSDDQSETYSNSSNIIEGELSRAKPTTNFHSKNVEMDDIMVCWVGCYIIMPLKIVSKIYRCE